jgi:hypothetical protein
MIDWDGFLCHRPPNIIEHVVSGKTEKIESEELELA